MKKFNRRNSVFCVRCYVRFHFLNFSYYFSSLFLLTIVSIVATPAISSVSFIISTYHFTIPLGISIPITLAVSGVISFNSVSYTHLRAHETDSYLVCRLLL